MSLYVQCPVTGKTPWGLLMTTHEQVEMAKRLGADGIDWWPYRLPLAELTFGAIRKDDIPYIRSCHMSFRGETVGQVIKTAGEGNLKGAAFSAIVMALLPHYYSSFDYLVALNQLTKHPIPSVIYPHHWWEGHDVYKNFDKLPNPLVQPSTEMVEKWGVGSLDDFVSYSRMAHVKFCMDLFHMNFIKARDGHTPIASWQEILTALMPHTKLIHLGAGRPDFKEQQNDAGIDSMVWLSDLIKPPPKMRSRIWDMLLWIKSHGYSHIPIVLEIPSSGIYEFSGVNSRFLSKSKYEQIMARIVTNIRQFFG